MLLVRAPEGFLGGRQWGWERPGLGAPKKACKAETIKISETNKDLNCPPSPISIGSERSVDYRLVSSPKEKGYALLDRAPHGPGYQPWKQAHPGWLWKPAHPWGHKDP